ncbi:MAG: hypothetical protein GY830_05580 [Bacteroidetes bacterium]|nr:hypothetical protein [Bacteroidota bacterium]
MMKSLKYLKLNFLSNLILILTLSYCKNNHMKNMQNKGHSPCFQLDKSININAEIKCINFKQSARTMIIGDRNGNIIFWNLDNNIKTKTIQNAHKCSIYGLKYIQDSDKLVSASRDGTIKIWDLIHLNNKKKIIRYNSDKREEKVKTIEYENSQGVLALEVNPFENLIVYGGTGKSLHFYKNNKVIKKTLEEKASSLSFNSNYEKLAVGTRKNLIYVYDCKKFKKQSIKKIKLYKKHEDIIRDISFFKSNQNLLASAGKDHNIFLWDIRQNNHINNIKENQENDICNIKFYSENVLISGNKNGIINFWDIRNPSNPLDFFKLDSLVFLNFIENNTRKKKILANANKNGTIQIWVEEESNKNKSLKLVDQTPICEEGISYTIEIDDIDYTTELQNYTETQPNKFYRNKNIIDIRKKYNHRKIEKQGFEMIPEEEGIGFIKNNEIRENNVFNKNIKQPKKLQLNKKKKKRCVKYKNNLCRFCKYINRKYGKTSTIIGTICLILGLIIISICVLDLFLKINIPYVNKTPKLIIYICLCIGGILVISTCCAAITKLCNKFCCSCCCRCRI